MRAGLLWSHVLASILGGLVVAGVLLAFGVIGKEHTETVPISLSAPPAADVGPDAGSGTAQIYTADGPGVVSVHAAIVGRTTSPFLAGVETAGDVSTGSGFLIAEKGGHGFIVTSFHVIDGSDFTHGITVQFNQHTVRSAIVVQDDPADDLALLQVSMVGVPAQIRPLTLGRSTGVAVGDSTLAIANPFGNQQTLTSGIIAAIAPQITGLGGSVYNVIETDASPGPGASGGPLLDANGDVIGVDSQIRVRNDGSDYTVSFAVPVNTVRAQILPASLLR